MPPVFLTNSYWLCPLSLERPPPRALQLWLEYGPLCSDFCMAARSPSDHRAPCLASAGHSALCLPPPHQAPQHRCRVGSRTPIHPWVTHRRAQAGLQIGVENGAERYTNCPQTLGALLGHKWGMEGVLGAQTWLWKGGCRSSLGLGRQQASDTPGGWTVVTSGLGRKEQIRHEVCTICRKGSGQRERHR